jgi:hypothetical protein
VIHLPAEAGAGRRELMVGLEPWSCGACDRLMAPMRHEDEVVGDLGGMTICSIAYTRGPILR